MISFGHYLLDVSCSSLSTGRSQHSSIVTRSCQFSLCYLIWPRMSVYVWILSKVCINWSSLRSSSCWMLLSRDLQVEEKFGCPYAFFVAACLPHSSGPSSFFQLFRWYISSWRGLDVEDVEVMSEEKYRKCAPTPSLRLLLLPRRFPAPCARLTCFVHK